MIAAIPKTALTVAAIKTIAPAKISQPPPAGSARRARRPASPTGTRISPYSEFSFVPATRYTCPPAVAGSAARICAF